MSFIEFLKNGLENGEFGENPEGDFARDAVADKNFREFKKWDDLEMYITFRGACREAVRAARKCFRKWEAARGQN